MNFNLDLYYKLEQLTTKNPAFFSKLVTNNLGQKFKTYNYRLASWTDFMQPGAVDSRGTMFEVYDEGAPKLVCLPPPKFFNYGEGNIDHANAIVQKVMDKRDGSLISSYLNRDGQVMFKTKGSIASEQVHDSTRWIVDHTALSKYILAMENAGYTVNMEWTSPTNRIVVGYPESKLMILSLRSRNDGSSIFPNCSDVPASYIVDDIHFPGNTKADEINAIAHALTEGEGYVVQLSALEQQYFIKCKSERYVTLHRNKDSIVNDRALYELTLKSGTDDLRDMFATDSGALGLIDRMEQHVFPLFNSISARVTSFYEANSGLDRKSYAIRAQTEAADIMPLIMNQYIGRESNVVEFMIRNYDAYQPSHDNYTTI